ncbi:MAG: 4-hydroxy-tetrahydrodipicolinate reductase [Clostridia bacterium]
MITVLINGIGGQMGRAVYTACNASDGVFAVAAGVDMSDCGAAFSCPVYRRIEEVSEVADVIIDFSVPAALPEVLRYAQQQKLPTVIGTTGLSDRDMKLIATAAERVPVFQTGNMSLGVNLQVELTKLAASTLGSDFDVEIIEKHHRKKIDAPSGTALMLANSVTSQHAGELDYVYGRHEKNKRRTNSEIGIHSIRGGTIVGEHEVLFVGNDEIVEITHKAYSKQIFTRGALRAAQYLMGKSSGQYNMQNVITEHDVASHLCVLEEQAVITLSGLPCEANVDSRVFDLIATRGVFVDMIAVSLTGGDTYNIGFSLNQAQLSDTLDALKTLKKDWPELNVHAHSDVVKLTVEGSGMALKHGVAALLFNVLAAVSIRVQLVTTSETKIEFCVDTIDASRAIDEMKRNFLG